MKKTVLLFIISNILFLNIYSQTKDEIIASFKNIVFKTENTFKGSNIALVSKDFSSSPTGKIYYKLKLELVYLDRPTTHTLTQSLASSLSYDIISTNSFYFFFLMLLIILFIIFISFFFVFCSLFFYFFFIFFVIIF